MDLRKRIQSTVFILFLFLTTFIQSTQSKAHGRRHKRQHGAHLYLPESFIIPNGEGRPDEWGPWSSPSECSRTCGGGVAYQTRECLNVGSDGQSRCSGGNKKFFSCNTQDCPESELDFRSQQCAHFDSVPFERVRYDWVPYTKAPNPCELNCMPRGERFYYRHKSKVIDGTRCNDESLDVCVEGVCQPVGCDMMIGSAAREDKCRKCAGDGSSCKTVSGLLDMNNMQVGYNDILLIPSGATNIDIKEISPSNNYLAIRNLSGHYYLNGNWRIDFPRPLTFAGAIWHYDRRPQGFAAPDHITCIGSTNEPVYLVLLYQDRNVGINYEYSVPEGSAHLAEPDTYSWTYTPYSVCSNSCGGGYQTRTVTCNSRTTLEQVDIELCDQSTRPSDSQKCGQESCPPRWSEGNFSKCSAICGNNGTQTRDVHCEHVSSTGIATIIDDSVCLNQVGNKPASVNPCNIGVICPEWHIGPWQPCNKLCGTGNQTRKLKCFKKIDGKITVLSNDECPDNKPDDSRECLLRPCEGVDWITSSWSGCKTCGLTQETRTAFCASKSGTIYNNTFCGNHKKPELLRSCEAPVCEYQWYKSQWSKCSAECGTGVQTRQVICGKFDSNVIEKTSDESKCSAEEKPQDTRDCTIEKECPGQWFSGPWTKCSKQCGGGIRTRKVLCLIDGKAVPETKCSKDNIEFLSDECNVIPCVDDETIPVDSTSKPIEEDDESEEYCDEEDEFEPDDGLALAKSAAHGLSTAIELDGPHSTEAPFITDDLMLSDSPGFETEGATDMSSQFDGSGESTTDEALASSSDGSGDEELLTYSQSEEDSKTQLTETTNEQTHKASIKIEDSISTTKANDYSSASTEKLLSEEVDTSITSIELSTFSGSESDKENGIELSSSITAKSSEPDSSTATLSSVAATSKDTSSKSTLSEDISSSETSNTPTSEATTKFTETTDSSSPSSITPKSSEPDSSTATLSSVAATSKDTSSKSTLPEDISSSETSNTPTSEATTKYTETTEQTSHTTVSETDLSITTESTKTKSVDHTTEDITEVLTEKTNSFETSTSDISTDLPETTLSSATNEISATSSDQSTVQIEVSTVASMDTSTKLSSDITTDLTKDISGPSTIPTSTDKDIEATTVDIWSTTSAIKITDDEEMETKWGSTPYTLEAIVTKEQTPRKCKLRPKTAACTKRPFGCCPDNSTAATGPFDEGCPTPETCEETEFGCCQDGLSPAKGPKQKDCPKPLCTNSLFGCCSDGFTEAEGEDNEGCPVITTTVIPTTVTDCTTSKFGCCSDGSEATGPNNKGCVEEECISGECTTISSEPTDQTAEITEETVTKKDCSRSKYGCCPDGSSEATGERFHGCSIIDEKDCTRSYFGCCPDNRTAAKGPNGEGCASCNQEHYGCCSDGITPAHGYNYEGCCLDTPYGCCPDNINPARGPQLEGCGCEYSPYGCCPDNKTSARGRNSEGCGCKLSQFGCCPDQQTPAQGEKYFGCPCHSFQFGCCPDGITIPLGPHNYGCHCSHSEFKCCSDGVTPAKGPNYEGCTCATSRYGCCPDGVSEAQGSNFNDCENIPVNPQKACSLKKDLGKCMEFAVKYFYDSEYGACTRFWYGGCGGNNNRFETNEDCVKTCDQPEGKVACLLPKIQGPCTGYYPSYYYDSDRNICSQFIYGGCLGNNNRFETLEACQKLCVVDQSLAACDQPVDTGICNGTYENWYYDKELDLCQPFNYGGCKGNKNRYPTEQSCSYHCKTPGSQKASCALPKETGQCDARHARWHYSETKQKCMPFYYTGCGGNANSYISLEQCETQCPPKITKDLCLKPAEVGECQNYTARWYYDTKEERCRQFYYGGCGGSENNFIDEQSCLSRCQSIPTTIAPISEPPVELPQFSADDCYLDYDSGPCRITEGRWYYNHKDGLCDMFAYGGCDGNANNFHSAEECESNCGNIQNPCAMPSLYGRCRENSTRWYYDINSDNCLQFVYSGCRGNKNNFYTDSECRDHCQRRAPTPYTEKRTMAPSIDTRFDNEQYDCLAPVAEGNCNDNIWLYFFNKKTAACEEFQYTGCGGNGNQFETFEQCERQCREYKKIDICKEHVDPGPCDQRLTKYYFNQMSESCQPFTYSGCEGNGNRFNSITECESVCLQRTIISKPNQNKEICSLKVEVGACENTQQVRKWFYDDSRGKCMSFIYNGCGGNANNFNTFESCVDFCTTNEEDNIIEHGDYRTAKPDLCHEAIERCKELHCPYGLSKTYDQNGCEQCECENPCKGYLCPNGSRCVIDIQSDPQLGRAFAPICREIEKPGHCPSLSDQTRCDRECYDDADCRDENKCCYSGCNYICVPSYEHSVTYPPELIATQKPELPPVFVHSYKPPALNKLPQNEIDVVQPEGDVATLRCFATGYPLPTVTWKRGTIIINTNQGRYVLTSTGDLQIVQVHRSDSGSYVCIADNGVGPPVQREVSLTVSDPVPGKVYIIGDANSTKIVNLKQSATIRCLAGGYPKPSVSWWKGSDLLPFKSDRFEVNRDYSLVFNRIELSDLGRYTCYAYSGNGKPVSLYVTLKAYGPVRITNKDEEQYLEYIVEPLETPYIPTTPTPYYPPYYPTIRQRPIVPEMPIETPVIVVQDPAISSLVPVSTKIILPNGNTFTVGSDISIECEVQGYPAPVVTWYKNDDEIQQTQRVQITESNRLLLLHSRADDSGYYKCSARNDFSQSHHVEEIIVNGIFVPSDCIDNQFFANCELIVKAKYCTHDYYARFCCKSCTLAGQLYFPTNLLL